jgi:CheY-like chemotaxis protein
VLPSSAAALQTWVTRDPRFSPHPDRTGLHPDAHTVLVVDDDRAVLRLTARMLRQEGYTVLEAGSGADALRMLDTEPAIRLVVTDVVMPGMHGLDLAAKILERERRPQVVLMTGHAAELSPQLERGDPALPLLLKPFTAQQLLKAVRSALGEERH